MSKSDYCPECGNDRNNEHERDGSQLCWCVEPDLRHPDRAKEELAVRRLLHDFFRDDDKALLWWCTLNPMLGGLTPDQLIEARPGKLLKIVKQALAENKR